MQITITVNLEFGTFENSNLKKETDNQMELPFFTRYRGRPKAKANWLDLKRVLEGENETKLRVSNLKFVCEKLKICPRTAYRIWKEMKQHLN